MSNLISTWDVRTECVHVHVHLCTCVLLFNEKGVTSHCRSSREAHQSTARTIPCDCRQYVNSSTADSSTRGPTDRHTCRVREPHSGAVSSHPAPSEMMRLAG